MALRLGLGLGLGLGLALREDWCPHEIALRLDSLQEVLGISLFSRGNYHYYLKHKFDCGSTDLANGSHAQEEFSMRER